MHTLLSLIACFLAIVLVFITLYMNITKQCVKCGSRYFKSDMRAIEVRLSTGGMTIWKCTDCLNREAYGGES
jgi:hypothetical protein